jgi:hypothetical protein
MARGRQLSQLLNQLQAEVGMSLLPASSVSSREHRMQLLNRTQDRLYRAYDWDFAFIKRDVTAGKGTRYLNFPVDLELERVVYAGISTGTSSSDWRPLGYGITETQYRITAEDGQGSPQRWAPYEDGRFELWPVPDGSYRVRFRGIKLLPVMVNDADRAVLDDTLVVLYAASEIMKRQKLPDWEDKLREGQLHFTRLRAQLGGNKRTSFVNGGGVSGLVGDATPTPVPGLDYMTS